jgi:hypothetical protein
MNVNLHIERLVLEGIDLGSAYHPLLQAALEAELGRLLAMGGLGAALAPGTTVASLPAGGLQLSADDSPTQLGRKIAQSVYRGIGK